ncbi:MAG: hypothetical protein IPM16_21580 [Chloroflexi bacterium]|nr:hypothetical protein [Chloroflexota bacterium]
MTNQSPWVAALRYLVIGIIWLGVLAFALIAALGTASGTVDASPLEGIGFAAFVGAAVATVALTSPDFLRLMQRGSAVAEAAKAKNEDSANPMALLTPEDLEDLRHEARERIRQRLIDGGDGELSTLDSLLAEDDRMQRRK